MQYSCRTISAPIRKQPSHSSEMISELLYGELVSRTGDDEGNWVPIQCQWDDYEGYVHRAQIEAIHSEIAPQQQLVDLDLETPYYPGSCIDEAYGTMSIDMKSFQARFLGTPYYWGGRTTAGIDCSGLSQIYYKLRAIRIPRDASMQALCGEEVPSLEEAQEGDLAFFVSDTGRVTHVGILLSSQQILHSTETQGMVVVDAIDAKGIIHTPTGEYSHSLKKIVRIYFDSDHISK